MADTALYVYCIVKSAKRPALSRVPQGLPGAAKPSVAPLGGPLWLIAAEVPLDTYGPGRLEAALSNMQWVGEIALAHEAVVEHFATLRGTTVVPMKLFTMFSTLERAVADTRARRRDITATMSRIAGCEEWGVRVIRTPPAMPRTAAVRATSGAGFLAAKKRARDEVAESARLAAETADDVYASLAATARDARRRSDVPEHATTPPLLDAAFLVPARGRTRFRTAARRAARACEKLGAQMTLTGPWPAYNFVQPTESR